MLNVQNLLSAYSQLKQNPTKVLQQLNIPQEYLNDPQGAIQHLMSTGKVSQQDYNNARNQLNQLQNNPLFKQYFK